jgi:UDP-glucose:(heptosyl)LPS alpha-1,3-glucosyltransferase
MKIGFIRQRYVAFGGAERYLNSVALAVRELGHEVHMFANEWRPEERLHFHHVPMIRLTSSLRALTFALNARRLVRRANCDVVFSMERTLEQDIYRAGDGCHREWLKRRARYISAVRNAAGRLDPFHRVMLGLEKRTFSPQRTRQIIANSHRGKREIIEHYGFPAERIDVIQNGVDCERFQPAPARWENKEVVLLFVGTGFERKGLGFCIGALQHLPAHVRLRIAGKGNVERFRSIAREHHVAARVAFLGTDQEISRVYREADLLIHPAIYEPFSNACVEALASGLPVITSWGNGASEIIEQGKSGAIIEDPGDTVALAEAIRPFLDTKFRLLASRHARAVAEAHPFSQNVAETLQVLTRVKRTHCT